MKLGIPKTTSDECVAYESVADDIQHVNIDDMDETPKEIVTLESMHESLCALSELSDVLTTTGTIDPSIHAMYGAELTAADVDMESIGCDELIVAIASFIESGLEELSEAARKDFEEQIVDLEKVNKKFKPARQALATEIDRVDKLKSPAWKRDVLMDYPTARINTVYGELGLNIKLLNKLSSMDKSGKYKYDASFNRVLNSKMWSMRLNYLNDTVELEFKKDALVGNTFKITKNYYNTLVSNSDSFTKHKDLMVKTSNLKFEIKQGFFSKGKPTPTVMFSRIIQHYKLLLKTILKRSDFELKLLKAITEEK